MPQIVSTPKNQVEDTSGYESEFQFGYFETKNSRYREKQEDALSWQIFNPKDLTPNGTSVQLSPRQIGYRLWTSYQLLDKKKFRGGTTASTTVYDGKGNLITATLADAAAFAAIYDKSGKAIGVIRLNSITHKPTDPIEHERIRKAGGHVYWGRVEGSLAVSRAIGDSRLKKSGVCSEATIDITNVSQLADKLQIKSEDIGKIQIITTCDGFTDAAEDQTKEGHERFLLETLQNISSPGAKTEVKLAKELVMAAKNTLSRDNISVAIQTITLETPPFLLGLYDGHGGDDASIYVAKNISNVLKEQCHLTSEHYALQEPSVYKKESIYLRDNPKTQSYVPIDAFPFPLHSQAYLKQEEEYNNTVKKLISLTQDYQSSLNIKNQAAKKIKPLLNELIRILKNEKLSNRNRINEFYTYLDSSTKWTNTESTKRIDLIKKDTSVSAMNYLKGIALLFASLVTGLIPGLLISGVVYAACGRHLFDLFKTNSERYEKELDLLKQNQKFHGTFFEVDNSSLLKDKENIKPDQESRLNKK